MTKTFPYVLAIDYIGTLRISGASRSDLVRLAQSLRAQNVGFFLGQNDPESPLDLIDYAESNPDADVVEVTL